MTHQKAIMTKLSGFTFIITGNKMTKTQKNIAANLLILAANEFSNHGCNDFRLRNTDENIAFVKEMIATSDFPDEEPKLTRDGKAIIIRDDETMEYLAKILYNELTV